MAIIKTIKKIFAPKGVDILNSKFMVEFQKPKRAVQKIFIHCSASDNPKHDDISVIRKWHVEQNKWADVGYHYFIKKDGTIQKGRALEKDPAAQYPFNKGTIAICLAGLEKDKFTTEQFNSLKIMAGVLDFKYNGEVTFHGHCEVTKLKTCPVFDYKKVLSLDAQGHLM